MTNERNGGSGGWLMRIHNWNCWSLLQPTQHYKLWKHHDQPNVIMNSFLQPFSVSSCFCVLLCVNDSLIRFQVSECSGHDYAFLTHGSWSPSITCEYPEEWKKTVIEGEKSWHRLAKKKKGQTRTTLLQLKFCGFLLWPMFFGNCY